MRVTTAEQCVRACETGRHDDSKGRIRRRVAEGSRSVADRGEGRAAAQDTPFTNNVTALDIADRGIAWATVSNMPNEQINRVKAEHG